MKMAKPRLLGRRVLSLALAGLITQTPLLPYAFAQNTEDLDKLFDDEEMDEPTGSFNQAPPPPPPAASDFDNSGAMPSAPSAQFNNPSPGPGTSPGVGNRRGGALTSLKPKVSPGKPIASGKSVSITDASIEDITNENYPELIESFDYPNADITDIVKAISQLTGKNFIIDPGVHGKITIVAPTRITVAEAYKAFLSALAMNGFTIVPSGKFLKIKNSRKAQRDSIDTYSGKYFPNSDLMITRIIHLKHISAEEVNKRLRVILQSTDGEMTPYEPTNSIIVSDYGSNIERIITIINELDRPGFEEQLSVLPIRYAKAKDIADLVNQIINKDPTKGGSGGAGGGFGAPIPRFRSRSGSGGSGTPEELSLVAPDDRTNSIIVVGNKAGVEKVKELVKKLDNKLDPAESGGVFVYYVKYGEAEKIAQTLSGLVQTNSSGGGASSASAFGGGAAGAFGGMGGGGGRSASPLDRQTIFGGDVKITADKNTNSLVITASKQDYEVVQSLLAKLDIPKDQVFVEAIIMEMNSARKKTWNPTYYHLDADSHGLGRAGFSTGNLQSIINPASDNGVVLGFGSGAKFNFTMPGTSTVVEIPSLLAFLTFIQQNTESNILSTPQILALDNEEAEIEVGDKIPVAQDSTTTGSTISSQTKFENATIKLTITPFIRPDSNAVRMKIAQSVKQPSKTQVRADSLKGTTIVISDRSIKTNIVVNNGDTAVLGGLVRDEEGVTESKVPLLGDIPVIGWLFKSRTVETSKVNLVVFLTPKIIRNLKDSQENLAKKSTERIDWLKKNFDGRDPYGKKMDTLPRAARAAEGEEPTATSNEPVKVNTKE